MMSSLNYQFHEICQFCANTQTGGDSFNEADKLLGCKFVHNSNFRHRFNELNKGNTCTQYVASTASLSSDHTRSSNMSSAFEIKDRGTDKEVFCRITTCRSIHFFLL